MLVAFLMRYVAAIHNFRLVELSNQNRFSYRINKR